MGGPAAVDIGKTSQSSFDEYEYGLRALRKLYSSEDPSAVTRRTVLGLVDLDARASFVLLCAAMLLFFSCVRLSKNSLWSIHWS